MDNQASTDQHLNNLNQFRQDLYHFGFTKLSDAQFELLDSLVLSGPVSSFPELSLSPVFRRRWPSAYAALEAGQQETQWLKGSLYRQVPRQGVEVFSLDGTAWPRPKAPTLADRQYVYSPTPAIDGGSIVVGYPYSLLAWVAQAQSSWALPLDIQRVSSDQDMVAVGVAQVKELGQQRQGADFSVVVADGKYGNHRFLAPLRNQSSGVLVRLRRDRVLYRCPPPYGGRGRPRRHGERFAFKEPQTWGQPQQRYRFQDSRWGRVEIEYWDGLHARESAATPFGVLRVQAHLEQAQPPDALWLGWQGPAWPADLLWRYYQLRWPVEPSIHWRKRQLHWTLPQFRDPGACQRWTMLVTLAQWLLYLARPLVQDQPLPWQKKQTDLTPGRVRQGMGALFSQIGTPAAPPKPRGKAPGWSKGRSRTKPPRYPVVKKGQNQPKTTRQAA